MPYAMNLAYRASRLANVPQVLQHLRYQKLRKSYNHQLWASAAERIGAEFSIWGSGFSRIARDGQTILVRGGEVMLDSHLTLELMGNKALVYQLMSELGCLVPDYVNYSLSTLAAAEEFLRTSHGMIVVKPAAGTGGGRGVTTGIKDLAALKKASRFAARYSPNLIAESQLEGHSFRLLYLDGELIDAVRRDPPIVVGDGRKTIRKLVSEENVRRLTSQPASALSPLIIDQDARAWLTSIGMSPSSKPPADAVITLKRAVNQNSAAQNHSVRDQVHPKTVKQGASLVSNLGVELAGVDVICRDIGEPLGTGNGLISEINTTPGLHHHYLVADPSSGVRVAELVLEHMYKHQRGTLRLKPGSPVPAPEELSPVRFQKLGGG